MDSVEVLWRALWYGFGLGYGLLVIGLLYVLKQAVLEPIIEWIWEWFEQRFFPPHPNESRATKYPDIGRVVVVSDLHVDTWDILPGGRGPREASFLKFLDTISDTTAEFYINGDLIDAPPNPNDTWSGQDVKLAGSLFPKYERVLAGIARLNNLKPVPIAVNLLFGNHDMAASGFQYDLDKRPHLLQQFQLPFNKTWYPNVVLGVPLHQSSETYGQEDYRFYMDHGHFYDPVLFLYLKDFLFAALQSDLRRAFVSAVLAGQRRSSELQEIQPPGIAPAQPQTLDQRIMYWLVRHRWRWKARRVLTDRNRAEVRRGHRPLTGGLFGHTHLPDRYTYRWGGAAGMTYVNTGDWAGNTGHTTYTVITQDGVIRQNEW